MPTITETLKTKLDELKLERRIDELTVATEKVVKRAIEHAGELAHDNRDKVATLLDKAGTAIDQRTEGKYHDTVGKVRAQVVTSIPTPRCAASASAPAIDQCRRSSR